MNEVPAGTRIKVVLAAVAGGLFVGVTMLSYLAIKEGTFPLSQILAGFATDARDATDGSDASLDSVLSHSNSNDFASALGVADRLLASDPDNTETLLLKAMVLAQEGSIEFKESEYAPQAIALANRVLELDPNNSEAWRIIGYAHEIMQQYGDAHDAYAKSMGLNPRNAATISQDAHAWDLQGDTAKAEAGYDAALALDPGLEQSLMGKGRIAFSSGDFDTALASFNAAYRSSSNARVRAEAAYSAGGVYGMKNDLVFSEAMMRQAIIEDPSYALAWTGLASAMFASAIAPDDARDMAERSELVNESFQYLLKATDLNPNQSAAHYQMGVQLAATGRKADALIVLRGLEDIVAKDITLSASDKSEMLRLADIAIRQVVAQEE